MKLKILLFTFFTLIYFGNLNAQINDNGLYYNVGLAESLYTSHDIRNFALSNGLEWKFLDKMSSSVKFTIGKNRSNEYTPAFSFTQYELNLNRYLFKKSNRLNIKIGTGLNYFRANGETVWLISMDGEGRTFSYKDISINTLGINMDLAFTFKLNERVEISSNLYAIPYFDNSLMTGVELNFSNKIL